MPIINAIKTDNVCHNSRNASIIIDQILFTSEAENISYFDYTIEWDGDFDDDAIISENNRSAVNLDNGTYRFTLVSLVDGQTSGPYEYIVSSPEQLIITGVQYKEFSCNDDGSIFISVSGGTAPYTYILNTSNITTNDTNTTFSNLESGEYSVSVTDSNGCVATYDNSITISSSLIEFNSLQIAGPTSPNGPGYISFTVTGSGPFSFIFNNSNNSEPIFIDKFNTTYLDNIADNQYLYKINNLLPPENYSITITDSYGCSSIVQDIIIPNFPEMSVDITITKNIIEKLFTPILTLPIYDTILIPYNHIINNTKFWQFIKNMKLQDRINIKVNNDILSFVIVRNMLDKYAIEDSSKIEILRLGNDSSDWFFYFYVAPGLDPDQQASLLNSAIKILNPQNNEEFSLTLGLLPDGTLDNQNASLIRGSLLLPDTAHNQFVNLTRWPSVASNIDNVYLSIGDNTGNEENYDFIVKNIKKSVYKNLYRLNYTTAINFLEQFNILNYYVNLKQTTCLMSSEDFNYVSSIKQILKEINNFDNLLNIYVYNLDNIINTGAIDISIEGADAFSLPDGQTINNRYIINYYHLDDKSLDIKPFYINNQLLNSPIIENLSGGYVIIRIRDLYNNIPQNITYNNVSIDYNNHFILAKNILQKYNNKITNKFLYGDILVYVESSAIQLDEDIDGLPQAPVIISQPTTPLVAYEIVKQTNDTTNTSQLLVNISQSIKHWIYGPKNYTRSFNTNTLFTNLLAGVYIIKGDDQELQDNILYQTEHRILVDPNTSNTIEVNFTTYRNQLFIMDN